LDPWLPLLKFMTGAGLISLFYLGHVSLLLKTAPAYLWMVAAPPDNELDRSTVFGRTFLALLMAFHLLYAFPCAAASEGIGRSAATGLCGDLVGRNPVGGGKVVGQHDGTRVAAGAAMAGIILLSAWHTRGAQKDYRASHRSIFPVPCESGPMPAMWKPFAGLVSSINSRCATFYTMPGLYSFHLWTRSTHPSRSMRTLGC